MNWIREKKTNYIVNIVLVDLNRKENSSQKVDTADKIISYTKTKQMIAYLDYTIAIVFTP